MIERDQKPAAHQHRHARPAPRAADRGSAGPLGTHATFRHAGRRHPL